jgi:hypothetical protein
MIPFSRRPECPKCKGIMFGWKYVPTWTHMDRVGPCPVTMGDKGEHLDLTCMDCGYIVGMATASGQ